MKTWVSIASALVTLAVAVAAQQPATFDVASVKPNKSGELMIRLDTTAASCRMTAACRCSPHSAIRLA